jgi:hypothetical protein
VRAFLVSHEVLPVAVVFHDHASGDLYCRSKTRSFSLAFDAGCSKQGISFQRDGSEGEILRAITSGPSDFDWARSVLDQLCNGFWVYEDLGSVISTEANVDAVIRKHLS